MPTHPTGSGLIPVSQIHPNPNQPRKLFDPKDLEDLKANIHERGLINPISVVKRGEGDFLIIAGERRYRSIVDLGWKEVDVRIWPEGTTAEEIEFLSLAENTKRKDLNAVEIANEYRRLSGPPLNLNQDKIAEGSGESRETVAQYLMISRLDPKVQASVIQITKLGKSHILQICRLKTPEMQISVLKEIEKLEDPTVKQVKTLVDRRLKPRPDPDIHPSARTPSLSPSPIPDPLAEVWARLALDPNVGPQGIWSTSYDGKARTFTVETPDLSPKSEMKRWFQAMADGIGDTSDEESAEKRLEEHNTAMVAKLTPEDIEDLKNGPPKIRLPKTRGEQAELESLAQGGPYKVYEWVYRGNKAMLKMVVGQTWKDFGVSSPKEGLAKLLGALRMVEDGDNA